MGWPLVEALEALVVRAGERALKVYNRGFDVEYKTPGDPVTEADKQVNELLVEALSASHPHAAIVAEESDPESYAQYLSSPQAFFVDPIDGTREFVAKNGQFVVMIGFVSEGAVSVGVVFSPTERKIWSGVVGQGARVRRPGEPATAIHVSAVAEPREAHVLCSRSHRSGRLARALGRLAPRQVQPMGSAGLKGAHVAQGSADLYVTLGASGKLWDSCALDAIVRAAGGIVTDTGGVPIDYRSPEMSLRSGLVVANPELHAATVALLDSDDASSP